jgi:hypothetical protein
MAGKRIERKAVRTSYDSVTHELSRTVIDSAQAAFEKVRGDIENAGLKLTDAHARFKFAELLAEFVAGLRPHTGGEGA